MAGCHPLTAPSQSGDAASKWGGMGMSKETPEQELARILAGPLTPEMRKMIEDHNAKMVGLAKGSLSKMVKGAKSGPNSKFK